MSGASETALWIRPHVSLGWFVAAYRVPTDTVEREPAGAPVQPQLRIAPVVLPVRRCRCRRR